MTKQEAIKQAKRIAEATGIACDFRQYGDTDTWHVDASGKIVATPEQATALIDAVTAQKKYDAYALEAYGDEE